MKDRTNCAFPMPAAEGEHAVEFGMTYRQWLGGIIAAKLFANDRLITAGMKEAHGDEVLARRKLAHSAWKLADILLEMEDE